MLSCVQSTCTKPRRTFRVWSKPPPRASRFIIARAGKPVVKVTAVDAPGAGRGRRLGFLAGRIRVPDDFDRMGATEIQAMFANDEVKLLLDTHLLLWAAGVPERLPAQARALVEHPETEADRERSVPVGSCDQERAWAH